MIKYLPAVFLFSFLTLQSQTIEWAYIHPISLSTNPFYLRNTVSVDISGNPVYSVLNNIKYLYIFTYFGDNELIKRNTNGQLIWSKTIYGKAEISRILVDKNDNIICLGSFKDTLSLDPSFTLYSSNSSPEYFLFKKDNNGNTLWLINLSAYLQNFYSITSGTVDDAGNIWLTAMNFLNSSILKFDAGGNFISSIVQTSVREANDISIDINGNIWVSGASFGFTNQSFNGLDTIPPFDYNEYVVKYSPDGTAQWVRFIEDITFQNFKIITDEYGNAYWSGNLFTSVWFGNHFAPASQKFFITKIDSLGNFIWVQGVPPGNSGDVITGSEDYLHYDGNGGVYYSGRMKYNINFGNGVVLNSNNSYRALLLKYSAEGDIVWGLNCGSNSDDEGTSVISDAAGSVYLTGRVGPNSRFGNILLGGSNMNYFITKVIDGSVPVELISFTGTYNIDVVELKWSTASEMNNMGFEIERNYLTSANIEGWETIGFVEGNGTTTEQKFYSYTDKNLTPGKYLYRLKQINFDGSFEYLTGGEAGSKGIEINIEIPGQFSLLQNYPNPFNPGTKINFVIPKSSFVNLRVFDILGNEVASLINEIKEAGEHEVEFNASDFSSGVYIYKLTADGFIESRKMSVIK